MQMNDSQRIPASKANVWAALNNPDILKQCIPGCRSLEMTSPTEMTATVVLKVGPEGDVRRQGDLVRSRSAQLLSHLG